MKHALALAITMTLASGSAAAATAPPPSYQVPASKPDPDYQFLFRPLFGYSVTGLMLTPQNAPTPEGKEHTLTWEPNANMKAGARVGYGPFLATITFDAMPADDAATHGESRGVEIGFTGTVRLDDREVVGTVFFARHAGYYLSNTEELFPQAASPLLAPKLALSTYGANLLFFFNPRFSYDDAFVEFRPRDKASLSPGLRLALGNVSFDSGSSALIPGKFKDDYGDAFGLTAVDATYASLGGGIGADWRPWGRMLLAVSSFVGATVSAARYRIWGYERHTPAVGLSLAAHLVAAYSGDVLHGGLLVTYDSDGMRIAGTDVNSLRLGVMLFLGIRL